MMSLTEARVPPHAIHVVILPFCISTPDLRNIEESTQTWPWIEELRLDRDDVGSTRKNEELRFVLPALLCGTLLLQLHTILATCPLARTVAIVPLHSFYPCQTGQKSESSFHVRQQ